MKVFLDASYIIYLKYSESDEIFDYCSNLLRELKNYDLIVNVVVLNEVVWILKKKYGIDSEEIFEFLDRFLDFVTIVPLDARDYELMREFITKYNLRPSDALHAASMKRFKAEYIVSEDADFDGVEWIRRIWIGRDGM